MHFMGSAQYRRDDECNQHADDTLAHVANDAGSSARAHAEHDGFIKEITKYHKSFRKYEGNKHCHQCAAALLSPAEAIEDKCGNQSYARFDDKCSRRIGSKSCQQICK